MPFYEYQCSACNAHVEVLQKISDAPLRKCPECGKQKLTRLISAPVFRLKGSGWYETDFKSDKENKRNLVDGPGGDSKDSGVDATAKPLDPKPADVKEAPKPAADKPAESAKSRSTAKVGKAAKPGPKAPPAKRKAAKR
ncbi:MAG: FmdB family zinc ribbon protein [Steroidobacteraceae bacterium]